MKSTVLALLPLAGLALAESVCQPKTVTKTVYAYEPESTSEAQVVKDNATPKPSAPTPTPSTCSRRTVTTTTVEKVTVTITADDVTTTKYSTSTRTRTTTVTVRPSKAPVASSAAAVPNPSPAPAATPATSATSSLPNFMLVGSSKPAASYAEQPSVAPAPSPSSTKASQQPAASPKADGNAGTSAAGSKSGDATFYGGNVAGGMCSFTGYTVPSNLFGTALSDSNWAGAQACGQCVKVTGPDGNQITAMVVDQCPNCGPNHLDLFPDAFAKLAQPSKGVIKVSWDFVPCGITSPIVLKNKSGTSKFWFSMQVMNSNVGVSKLEVSTDGGSSWKATTRQPYNFFENSSGFGTDSVDVKITSIDGKTIVVKDVSIADSTTKTTGENF